jgi:hypothetical protein
MSTRRLFEAILAIAIFAMSVRENIDADLWWHLRTGEAIVANGRPPTTDLFSYTIPDHLWIVQQWLTDLFMWQLYQVAGLPGLIIVFALVVTAAFMLVYACCAGRPYLATFVILLAYLTSALPVGARPQMFNMLFLALCLLIIERVRARKWREWTLFLLPPITLLWANMHSGFLTGIVVLGAYVAGEAVQRWLKKPDELTLEWSGVWKLAAAVALSLLAALVNPSGLDLLLFPLGTLGSEAIQGNIVEWFSPDFHSPYWWFFGAMLALGAISLIVSQRRVTATDLLIFLGTGWMGLTSVRHIPLFALAAAPVIARHLLSAFEGTRLYPLLAGEHATTHPSRFSRLLNTAVLLLMLLVAAVWAQTRLDNMEYIINTRFPVAAVDFIEANGLADGRIFNAYNWGGYLIWRRIPVFIDGRTELYGDAFFRDYLQTFQVREGWARPLDEYAVDTVLVDTGSPLATLLHTAAGWQEVYRDEIATIFTRETTTD